MTKNDDLLLLMASKKHKLSQRKISLKGVGGAADLDGRGFC